MRRRLGTPEEIVASFEEAMDEVPYKPYNDEAPPSQEAGAG